MNTRSRTVLISLALVLAFSTVALAQDENRERYIISAKAGGVNYASGNVTVERKNSNRSRVVTTADSLSSGDLVTTGAGGRLEVLLNPGTYMRVSENTEFELTDASLDSLLVKLVKGSAVIEVSGEDGVNLAIGINTPQTDAVIVKGGIYRFNVLESEITEILVRKGKLLYGKGSVQELKGGRKLRIGRGLSEIVKLNKKDLDWLDIWSQDRAEFLARANRRLQNRPLLTAFNDFSWNDWSSWRSSSFRGSAGVWVYNPASRSHCFLPVGGRAGSSPYGHSYGNGLGHNGSGRHWNGNGGEVSGGNGSPSGGGGNSGSSAGNGASPSPAPAPAPQPISPPVQPSPPPAEDRAPRQDYRTPG